MAAFVGVDVAKARLDVAIHDGAAWSVANNPAGIAALLAQLPTDPPQVVVLEATGGVGSDPRDRLGCGGHPGRRRQSETGA